MDGHAGLLPTAGDRAPVRGLLEQEGVQAMNRRAAIQHLVGLWEDASLDLSIDEASNLDDQTRVVQRADA